MVGLVDGSLMVPYKEFLDQYYPSKESEQNAAIQLDRLSSFARWYAPLPYSSPFS